MVKFQEKTQSETEWMVEDSPSSELVLYNDDVNTFDWVILCLVEICQHEPLQAEQCAYIVHTKGKCGVKNGEYQILEPMCSALLERGLSAEIH